MPSSEAPFSTTVKIGTGYDAPLITVRGENWNDYTTNLGRALGLNGNEASAFAHSVYRQAYDKLGLTTEQAIHTLVNAGLQPAVEAVAPAYAPSAPLPTVPQPGQTAPSVGAKVAPPGVAYPGDCPHGRRVFEDKPARGKSWLRWECALPWVPGQAKGTRCDVVNVR